jgi:hypothetical protein
MIFNRFIPPFGGGDNPPRIELFLDWGEIGDFLGNSPYPPPQNTTASSLEKSYQNVKNWLNLDEGHRGFP